MERLLVAAEALTLIAGATPLCLDIAVRSRVNAALDTVGLDGERSFQTIGQGLSAISTVLQAHGLRMHRSMTAGTFTETSGQRTASIENVSNSLVRIGWFQGPSGHYEITAYLS